MAKRVRMTAPNVESAEPLEQRLARAERAAAETRTLLDTLLTAAPVGVGFVDREFRMLHLNEALAAVNGAPLEEQLGRLVAEVVPDIWPKVEPIYRHVIETGEAVLNVDVSGGTATDPGVQHHWLVSYYPVRLVDEIIGIGLVAVDITDRQHAVEALAASEARFRLLSERTPDIVYRYRLAPTPGIEYVSPAAAVLAGYAPEDFYADPELWTRLVHPDDRARVESAEAQDERDGPIVARWVRRDGSILWTEDRRVRVYGADGSLQAIEGAARDVTWRVEAEQRLRASEARFRQFLADIDLGALMLDRNGRVDFINDHLLELLERTRDEVLGRDWIDLAVPEPDRAALRGVFRDALATGTGAGQREDGIITRSGEQRRLAWTSVVQLDVDGRGGGIAGIAHDVTELHRLEAERALLAAAVEQTAEAIIVTDPAANIVFVNPAFERVSGYARDEILGTNPRFLQAGTLKTGVYREMWLALRSGRPWDGELANQRKDGTEYIDSVTITPIFDPSGALSAYMSVQRDVSHVREVEADLVLEARVRAVLGEAIAAAEGTATLEEAAQGLCDGLASLPGIAVVQLVAFLDVEEAVVIASRRPAGFPVAPGDSLPAARARYLQTRAASGPWGERPSVNPTAGGIDAEMRSLGITACAFGPIRHGDHVGGVLIVGTQDSRFAMTVAEKMPPLVGFGASSNSRLVDLLHARRRKHALRRTFDALLASRAFHPVFQPIVDLESGEAIGFEALTRFDSGTRPDVCFADAWSVGMGVELELATLEAAAAAAKGLPAGRWLSLNVSPRLLDKPDRLAALIRSAERPIVLEITEHDRIADYRAVRDAVAALGNGVRLAVDDAGVGIANFGHIIELRPDFVKIDISLVRRVNSNLGRQALVIAMHHFARTAGCALIAEGIETQEESGTLRTLGVEFGQGYLFGRPQPLESWASGAASATEP